MQYSLLFYIFFLQKLLTDGIYSDIIYIRQQQYNIVLRAHGELSEWLKEHAWKACIRVTVSRVQIPHSPPLI